MRRRRSARSVPTLIMNNLIAAIDGFDREAAADFADAAERFAKIVESEAANVG